MVGHHAKGRQDPPALYGGNCPLKVAFGLLSGVITTVNGLPYRHQAL